MKSYIFLSILFSLHSCTNKPLKQQVNSIYHQTEAQIKTTSLNQESANSDSILLELMSLIQGKWKYEGDSNLAMIFEGNKRYDYGYDSVVYTFEISYDSYLSGNLNDGIPYINGRSDTDSNDDFFGR